MTNNEKESVLQYIYNTYEKNSFVLGRFRFPKLIGKYINVQNCRDEHLHSRKSGELNFISDFLKVKNGIKAGKSGTYIEQFPIPIDNKDLWLKYCNEFNVNDREMLRKRLLLPDLYLPYHKIVIEVDYPSSHNKIWDKVRDKYLYSRFNILTYRINLYNQSSDYDKYQLDSIKFMLNTTKDYISSSPYEVFDFKDFYLEDFKETFKDILDYGGSPNNLFKSYFKK